MADQSPTYLYSDLIKLVCSLVGLGYFINLIKLDTEVAYRKRAHWIPGNAFILSALTIQILSYMDTTTVNISDKPNIQELTMLLGNHLLIDSGRLIICVFMGYLLPGMARPGSGGDWGDISALAISLFTDITSELYFLHRSKSIFNIIKSSYKVNYGPEYDMVNQLRQQPSIRTWYIVSSLGILVSVIFLILFLGCTIVAGNTIRGLLAQRIAMALSTERVENSWKGFEEQVLKSWIVARACRPEYVIARSVLSSAAGMVVTLRIALSLMRSRFMKFNDIVRRNDSLDDLRQATFVFQCVFVFIGWIAICWRWITAVVYFPRRKNTTIFFVVEDFWTRRIMEFRYSWENRIAVEKEKMLKTDRLCTRIILCVQVCWMTLMEMSVTSFLRTLQSVVVLFSKVCWFSSEIVMGNEFIRGCLLRDSKLNYYTDFAAESRDYTEFVKYREVLDRVRMPEESAGSLWVANLKSIRQTIKRMEDGCVKAGTYKELITFVKSTAPGERFENQTKFESLPLVKAYFPNLDKMCWKMTAVSYVKLMVELFPSPDPVDRAMKAFMQADVFMKFLDSADIQANEMNFLESLGIETDQVGEAADQEFKRLEKSGTSDKNIGSVEAALEEIGKLQQSAHDLLRDNGLVEQGADARLQDSRDLRKIAPSYSLYRVCKHLVESNGDDVIELKDLWKKIEDHLGNVLACSVSETRDKLVENCREWATDFEEDKIWEAVYMAGKVKGLLENCEVSPRDP